MGSKRGQAMRLLSLDGGGIRGLSSLYILQNLMHKVKFIEDREEEPLPCNYFDMICGTSTGGIIALMLGRLRMSASECIDAYLEMSQKVFGQPQGFTHREKFSAGALEQAVKEIVARKTADENAPLIDPTCCKTFVCAYDQKTLGGSPVLLRTYPSASAPIDCTIWEAARATSAAPTFFPPIKLENLAGGELIDGGMGCNNPTKALIKEAKAYHRLKGYATTRPTCLVSIGTGQKDLIQLHKAASVFWFKDRTGLGVAPALAAIVTDCEDTHDEVTLSAIEDDTTRLYFRFNVPQGMQNIVLDEWAKANDIKTYTDKYMRLNEIEHQLLSCVTLLRHEVQQSQIAESGERDNASPSHSQLLRISQTGSEFSGPTTVSGGKSFQGNFIGFERGLF